VLVVFGLAAVYGAVESRHRGRRPGRRELRAAAGRGRGGGRPAGGRVRALELPSLARLGLAVLGITGLLLLIPLLPFTHPITPTINGARRW